MPQTPGGAPTATAAPRPDHRFLPGSTLAGVLVAIAMVVLVAVLSLRSMHNGAAAAQHATAMREQLRLLRDVLLSVQDAETGQRGYLLTADESYLDPYLDAQGRLPGQLQTLRTMVATRPDAGLDLATLEQAIQDKLEELQQTIAEFRDGDRQAALAMVRSDRGRLSMDRIRLLLDQGMQRADASFQAARESWQRISETSLLLVLGGLGLLLLLIAAGTMLMAREFRAREIHNWLRNVQMALSTRLAGDQRVDGLADNALDLLARAQDAPLALLYLHSADARMQRAAAFGLAPDSAPATVTAGEGLLGEVVRSRQVRVVSPLPADYLPRVGSALGHARPTHLLLAPVALDGQLLAVLEFGFFAPPRPEFAELLRRIGEPLAMAVRAAHDRVRLEDFLEEVQRQAEELQTQQEELKVNNEELEEQSRALRESQAQMEAQQVELEQTNAQLEEQAQVLEHQASQLAESQRVLLERSSELERASQFKSEFLANMSHELRTPLNSTLILAKLLADNKQGNLGADQVRFAQTIHAAGNDLLALINDILDLAKIEAGKVDLQFEAVPLEALLDEIGSSFAPLAAQKQLTFSVGIEPGTPATLKTDERRLGQVLKNLLSNAFKFTNAGTIELRVAAAAAGGVQFAVRDTGIGIDPDQQQAVFEAFRQADGSTHRKYGGTGLGLSISRNLAELLGGALDLSSTPGVGSVFTLTLPADPAQIRTPPPVEAPAATITLAARDPEQLRPITRPARLETPTIADDRGNLRSDVRLVLVVEDDVAFAGILRDVAHEAGFQCVVTHTAGDALLAVERYAPSAVLLDMNLPDRSGLVVLDELKRDLRFRHMPVHVISVADYSREALARGAVGYALKPVRREQLLQAFAQLDLKLSQRLRRVLVVEDDARQRDSIRALLATPEVDVVAAETAAIALELLAGSAFDCVIMDLNLPDLSGYELLEQMAAQQDQRFPPVIVYTGRTLSADEEQRLRRYSRSIIVKDARSPERLLDEVTLFLHQVESSLPQESQRLLQAMRGRDEALKDRQILVVEDDVRNIFALTSVLEPLGARVRIARNGREALTAVDDAFGGKAEALDLVLMDVMMPEMDGLSAMREIRLRHPARRLPIIALTAKAMPDDQEKCLAAGANDYIAKPLDVDKLLSLLRVWMPR